MTVRTRIAPSPTGEPHLGFARTALFDYLLARHYGGEFYLRIEDTDRTRYAPEVEGQLHEALAWLGLKPDPIPGVDGTYRQSEHLNRYRAVARDLVTQGAAYPCFCSAERLAEVRKSQEARHEPPRYDRHCRHLDPADAERRIAAGEPYVIRQAMPQTGATTFHDAICGDVTVENRELDDHILLKSDGFPTYHLAAVVDDHDMAITHVIRGSEWLASAPKHILLYEALDWESPIFAHVPVILGPDKGKLSKRHGAKAVLEYRAEGYLPEALVNFLVLLGWSSGSDEELFTLDELAKRFTLERVHPSPARFDFERLLWFNGIYIRKLPIPALRDRLLAFYGSTSVWAERYEANPAQFDAAVGLAQEKIKTLAEFAEAVGFIWDGPSDYAPELLVPKKSTPEATKQALGIALDALQTASDWRVPMLETALRDAAKTADMPVGQILWPVRAALTGLPASPGAFEVLEVLGRDESYQRIRAARRSLGMKS